MWHRTSLPQTKDSLLDTQGKLRTKTLDYARLHDRLEASDSKKQELEKELARVNEECSLLEAQVRPNDMPSLF